MESRLEISELSNSTYSPTYKISHGRTYTTTGRGKKKYLKNFHS
jgi:hypothetical protein